MRKLFRTPRTAAVIAVIASSFAIGAGTAAASRSADASHATAHAARTCSSGFRHGRINGVEKCLRAGEYCAHAYDRHAPHHYAYTHYGYRCVKRDSRGSYHLTYA
jgi:hypothetical protein